MRARSSLNETTVILLFRVQNIKNRQWCSETKGPSSGNVLALSSVCTKRIISLTVKGYLGQIGTFNHAEDLVYRKGYSLLIEMYEIIPS